MVKAFGWSLRDIDETEIESLMDFINRLTWKRNAYCDEVDFL